MKTLGIKRRADEEEAEAERQAADAEAKHGAPHPRLVNLEHVRLVQDGVAPAELCRELMMLYRVCVLLGREWRALWGARTEAGWVANRCRRDVLAQSAFLASPKRLL